MRQRGLQSRITTSGAVVLSVTAAIIILYGTASLRNLAQADAMRELAATAEAKAKTVESAIGAAINTARTVASMALGARGSGTKSEADSKPGATPTVTAVPRAQFDNMLRSITAQRTTILGTYVGFEPNAYDGQDKAFAKTEGHDETGRYIPYLVRNPDGKLELTPLVDYENKDLDDRGQRKGEYYLRPRESKQECIIDPFEYPVGGVNILMTSLLCPILEGGTFLGMAGADMDLKFIQELVDKTSLYNGKGRLILVSNKGWVAGMSGKKDAVGKQLKEVAPDLAGMAEDIAAGKAGEGVVNGWLTVRHPITFGETTTPWALIVQVPRGVTLTVAAKAAIQLVLLSLFCIALGAAALGITAKRAAAPVSQAIVRMGEAANHVASGSGQVASTSGDLASNASEQASSLEETSASLEQMSSMTAQNADNAQQASTVAEEARKAAQQGDSAMARMVQTMDEDRKSVV